MPADEFIDIAAEHNADRRRIYGRNKDGKVTLANGSPYWYSSCFDYCRGNGIIPDKSSAFEPGYDRLLRLADTTITRAGFFNFRFFMAGHSER